MCMHTGHALKGPRSHPVQAHAYGTTLCVRVRVRVRVRVHVRVYARVHACMYMYMHMYMHVYMCQCNARGYVF